ncbi:hypothetical protein GQX74_012243 [Glossina fuscipes]|nr:hypothetical protein GQX74_012243 [Glossina fuscipes]
MKDKNLSGNQVAYKWELYANSRFRTSIKQHISFFIFIAPDALARLTQTQKNNKALQKAREPFRKCAYHPFGSKLSLRFIFPVNAAKECEKKQQRILHFYGLLMAFDLISFCIK